MKWRWDWFSPVSIILPMLDGDPYVHVALEGQAGGGWELPKEQRLCESRGALGVRVLYNLETVKMGAVKAEGGKEISGSE
jgi:hypothetical protein